MNKISDRQIELLKKIYYKTITKAEAKEYITLVLTDNALGAESLPSLKFLPESKMASAYGMMCEHNLYISTKAINDIINLKDDIFIVINAIGHELKHYKQRHIDYNELQTNEAKQYHQKVYDTMTDYNQAYGDYLAALKMLESPANQKTLKAYFKDHPNEPLSKWFMSRIPEERENFANNIEEARYLGQQYEIDARFSGILFATMMFQKYISDSRIQSDSKLHKWLIDLKECGTTIYTNDYADDLELSQFYDEFQDAMQNVSREFLQDTAEQVAQLQKTNTPKKQVFESLLHLACMGYVESIDNTQEQAHKAKTDLKNLFMWALQNISKQNSDGSATKERVLACKMASAIYFDSRLDTKDKSECFDKLFGMYYAHAQCPKEKMTYGSKVHKFDSFDTYFLHIASINADNCQFSLMEELDNNGRYNEICKFIDFKQLYLKELDADDTLPEHYIHNIAELLAGKCEMLIEIKSTIIKSNLDTKSGSNTLNWYISAIEKTMQEMFFLYFMQEEKDQPKTEQELQEYIDYIKTELSVDINQLKNAQKQACKLVQSYKASQKERE